MVVVDNERKNTSWDRHTPTPYMYIYNNNNNDDIIINIYSLAGKPVAWLREGMREKEKAIHNHG